MEPYGYLPDSTRVVAHAGEMGPSPHGVFTSHPHHQPRWLHGFTQWHRSAVQQSQIRPSDRHAQVAYGAQIAREDALEQHRMTALLCALCSALQKHFRFGLGVCAAEGIAAKRTTTEDRTVLLSTPGRLLGAESGATGDRFLVRCSRCSFCRADSWEPVGLGASIAKIDPSEDSFRRICSPIAQLWGKKTVKNGPLRSICSRRSPSPKGS